MSLLKFKIVFILMGLFNSSFAMFSEKECLDLSYSVEVGHKDKITFGMAKTKLSISKEKCEITVGHEKLKFMKNRWKVDVCREPVHIKSGVKGVEVLKKNGQCPNKNSTDFCDAVVKIQEIIQDDGLIFAPGEKENLSTDHGKVYCAYQLLGGYLEKDRIFSRYSSPKPAPAPSLTPAFEPKEVPTDSQPAVDPTGPRAAPPENKTSEEGTF